MTNTVEPITDDIDAVTWLLIELHQEGRKVPEANAFDRIVARLSATEEENKHLRARLHDCISSLDDLIAESEGVYGLHRNGETAPWEDLVEGGAYCEWLSCLERARNALNKEKNDDRL